MALFIHQRKDWPKFSWDNEAVIGPLAAVRHRQGRLLGHMENIGFNLQNEASLQTIALEVIKSSEIEGEILNPDQVRSSIARRLGMDIPGLVPADRNVEGIVDMMLDATQRFEAELTTERLFDWHAALFPTGRSNMRKIVVGAWRDNAVDDPMQVVSGPMGRERVHFQAPDSQNLDSEMNRFLSWFKEEIDLDPLLKAAVAHFWVVTIHPFDDGNGRIARAIADMQLARADNTSQRFYSMSMQIRNERKAYYDVLEKTQKGDLDITDWILWFLDCLDRALLATGETLHTVLRKAAFWQKWGTSPLNERQKLMLNKLMDGFAGKLNSSKWAKIAKCSQDTASRDINRLIDLGILLKSEAGGRSTSYDLNSF